MNATIPAIWVRFTPYLADWTEEEFGTGLTINGRRVLELRKLQGVKNLLREAVTEDIVMNVECKSSMSQLRYDVITSLLDVRSDSSSAMQDYTTEYMHSFLPVHVPDHLLMDNGVIRPFSTLMQLRRRIANAINYSVYHRFWLAVWEFSKTGTYAIDKDMLMSFCEEHAIPTIHIDDLRNQFQRMKRQGFFANIR